tara:strand:- start:44 stop:271 length:228 start_codon:yes stop_codon:yes gene_type:complete
MKLVVTRDGETEKYIDGIQLVIGSSREKVLDFFVSLYQLKKIKNLFGYFVEQDEEYYCWSVRFWIFNIEYTSRSN